MVICIVTIIADCSEAHDPSETLSDYLKSSLLFNCVRFQINRRRLNFFFSLLTPSSVVVTEFLLSFYLQGEGI